MKHLQHIQPSHNTFKEVVMLLSKSTINRRLHECKYRGITTRCKPLVPLKNREVRFDFRQKTSKSPAQLWNKILCTRLSCTRVIGRVWKQNILQLPRQSTHLKAAEVNAWRSICPLLHTITKWGTLAQIPLISPFIKPGLTTPELVLALGITSLLLALSVFHFEMTCWPSFITCCRKNSST